MHKPSVGFIFRNELPPEKLQDFARRVEAGGFDEFWLVEDCFFAGGISSSAVALAATTTVSVGLGIMPAVVRNPAFAAMEIAALARLYPGRFHPGFGHGVPVWMQQVGALPAKPIAALEESVRTVRQLLSGERVTTHSQYIHLDEVQLNHPPHIVPPLSLGVRGPQSMRLAGRVADGTIIGEGGWPGYVSWAREQIAAGMERANRTGPHRLTVYAWFCMDDDVTAARKMLRPFIEPLFAPGVIEPTLPPLPFVEERARLHQQYGAEIPLHEIPDEWIDEFAILGNVDHCKAGLQRLVEAGADAVVLAPLTPQAYEQLERAIRDLLPAL